MSDYGNVKNPRCWYEFQEDIDRLKFREYIYEDSYSYNEQCSQIKPCICEYDSSAFQNIYSYEKRDTGICSETNEVLSKELNSIKIEENQIPLEIKDDPWEIEKYVRNSILYGLHDLKQNDFHSRPCAKVEKYVTFLTVL